MARFEVSRYGREARAWLKRLVPMPGSTFPYFRSLHSQLEEKKGETATEYLTTMQSFEISRYVHKLEGAKFAVMGEGANTAPYEELFTGGDVDIEDILIHQYGFNADQVYQALGPDPNYLQMKAELEKHRITQQQVGDVGKSQ